MPKKPRLNSELAPRMEDEPFLQSAPLLFSVEERGELRKFFESPAWKKAIHNARLKKPSLVPNGLDSALGQLVGNNRLHELRGWTMCEIALATQIEIPAAPRTQPKDNYAVGIDAAFPGAPKPAEKT